MKISELYSDLASRIANVLQDMANLGWKPKLTSGYRSLTDQLSAKRQGLSSVSFGYHNVTDPVTGSPQSMAVHVIDQNLGYSAPKGHPFWNDLERCANRWGLYTGNQWKRPWDPAHVQLYSNQLLQGIRKGYIPPLSGGLQLGRFSPSDPFRRDPFPIYVDRSNLEFLESVRRRDALRLKTSVGLGLDSLRSDRPWERQTPISIGRPEYFNQHIDRTRTNFLDAFTNRRPFQLSTSPNLMDPVNLRPADWNPAGGGNIQLNVNPVLDPLEFRPAWNR